MKHVGLLEPRGTNPKPTWQEPQTSSIPCHGPGPKATLDLDLVTALNLLDQKADTYLVAALHLLAIKNLNLPCKDPATDVNLPYDNHLMTTQHLPYNNHAPSLISRSWGVQRWQAHRKNPRT